MYNRNSATTQHWVSVVFAGYLDLKTQTSVDRPYMLYKAMSSNRLQPYHPPRQKGKMVGKPALRPPPPLTQCTSRVRVGKQIQKKWSLSQTCSQVPLFKTPKMSQLARSPSQPCIRGALLMAEVGGAERRCFPGDPLALSTISCHMDPRGL